MTETEAEKTAAERRVLDRMPTTLRGKVFPGPVDCVVKDFNERGAKLQFEQAPPEGERLVFVVWTSGMAFEAQVRWRAGNSVGVQFIQRCDFRARTPAMFWPARTLWLKSRKPLRRTKVRAESAMIEKPVRGKVSGFG